MMIVFDNEDDDDSGDCGGYGGVFKIRILKMLGTNQEQNNLNSFFFFNYY